MGIDKLFKEVFNLDENTVLKGMSPRTLEEWDSLGHLTLIGKIEDYYSIKFSFDEMVEIESYDDIVEILKLRGLI